MPPQEPPPAPHVSVLMSVLEPDLEYLRQALQSLCDQTLAAWELVLLEDPGGAPVGELVAELADPRIRHVRGDQRTDLAESRRRAMELSRAELVAILDGDDVAMPRRLELQAGFLDTHPDVDVVGSAIEIIRPDGTVDGARGYPDDHAAIVGALPRYNPLAHPTVMMRKAAVLAAGGYRQSAGGTVDDYELWSRMASRGHRFANLPAALVRYRLHPGSMKATRLRQTLADTIWVKRHYWRGQLGLRGRLRLFGEIVLGWLPPRWVHALFELLVIRRRRGGVR